MRTTAAILGTLSLAAVAALTVTACSGAGSSVPGPGGDAPGTGDGSGVVAGIWSGDVDVSRCGAPGEVAPLRCVAAAGAAALTTVSCGDLAADNTLSLATRPGGATLVVGGRSRTASPLRVAGSFTSLGGIQADNTEDIDGDLRTNGSVTVSSPMRVSGDATVLGALDARNTVTIGGALAVAQPLDANALRNVTAASVSASAQPVASPIDCAAAPDLASLSVLPAGSFSDESDALAAVKVPTSVTLGCGRYVLSEIGADNTLDLHVEGRTVLVVRGDLRVAAPMRIDLAPGASLDLLVGGSLRVDNTLSITQPGTATGPAHTDTGAWVAVAGPVHIAAPLVVHGWLLAPRAELGVDNTLQLRGAAYVGSVRVASPMTVIEGPAFDGRGCVLP